jgi:hypothetical protein
MPQLEITDQTLPDFEIVKKLFDISSSKKITKTIEQNNSILVMYESPHKLHHFDNKNRNLIIIPDTLFIKDNKEIYITRNIELQLQWYPQILEIIALNFPHLESYIKGESIFTVNIKPTVKVSSTNNHRIEEEINDFHKSIGFLENTENQEFLGCYVLGEIIRKLYCGEQDLMNGFLIFRSTFKYLKAIVNEKADPQMLIDKLKDNPNVVDVDNFFLGSDGKFYLKILKNVVFYTPKKSTYFNFLDLKYLAILDTLGNLLDQKTFGRKD